MVDGHPRPACGFGLLYALAGIQYDAVDNRMAIHPVSFPLRIALTHLADWEREVIPWLAVQRSIPNQDKGPQAASIQFEVENEQSLGDLTIRLIE